MNSRSGDPVLFKEVPIPRQFRRTVDSDGTTLEFGGDVRIGDLTGDGVVDFLVFRCAGGGLKPTFLGAFDLDGDPLWHVGEGGGQPLRPGPVTVYDIDADGASEVVHVASDGPDAANAMENAVIQVRDGATGELEYENAPAPLVAASGSGPNWTHHRLLVANLRGRSSPQDVVLKLGSTLVAFDDRLEPLWTYDVPWNEYGEHTAYVPAVGDIDDDGHDEVTGGHYLIDHDGSVRWEQYLGDHMDSVAITGWDGDTRVIAAGNVVDADGNVLLDLGPDTVPHGQEVRVADFLRDRPGTEMVIRYEGHAPRAMTVGTDGDVLHRFTLNDSPNHTGMMDLQWDDDRSVVYNGGVLFEATGERLTALPGLPAPSGPEKMGWYHCIPADVCGDSREEAVVYNPWDCTVWIYTPAPLEEDAYDVYCHGPRQYNPRLMD